jgi:hypothetical protein
MKVGIIGLARSGKTTIFNALTDSHAPIGAFGAREANVAVVKVPDERLTKLAELYNPKKITPAEFQFVDIAPHEGGDEQRALDAAALNALKQVEALVHVVRAFVSPTVMHPMGGVNPRRDFQALEDELQLSDLIIIERRLERLHKEGKKDREADLLERCKAHIEEGQPLRTLELNAQEEREIAGFCFLSQKAIMLLGNYGDEKIGQDDPSGLQEVAQQKGLPLIELCGAMESEVADLPEEDRQAFRDDLGLGEGSKTRFVQAAYDMLGLMSFLTAGEPEVRAWTIHKGTKAVDAAGVIHSDIKRGFIRAEVVAYDDLISARSIAKAKEKGAVRLEGKEYEIKDGDVILFRFNV